MTNSYKNILEEVKKRTPMLHRVYEAIEFREKRKEKLMSKNLFIEEAAEELTPKYSSKR